MNDRVSAEFSPCLESLDWADQAVSELDFSLRNYFALGAGRILTELEPTSGFSVSKFKLSDGIPTAIRRKATEALTTTRHAFDQAAFAARNITSGPSSKSIYFPWANSPDDLRILLERREYDERLWAVYEDLQPYRTGGGYPGGDDIIRRLARLANDKHTVGLSIEPHISMVRFPDISAGMVEELSTPPINWDSRKGEAVLLRWKGDVVLEGGWDIRFSVYLKDDEPGTPIPVVEGLRHFTQKARSAAISLKEACRSLG